jgi:DNA-binding NarL/FixJ family response regulator
MNKDSDELMRGATQTQEPREGLEAVVALRRLLEMLEATHVENAIRSGWSWSQVAEVLGVSKQAVHKKHAKRLRSKLGGSDSRRR